LLNLVKRGSIFSVVYEGRDFTTTLVEGNKTEDSIKRLFSDKGFIVQDCSTVKEYQEQDIDFLVKSPQNGNTLAYEVKSDNVIAKSGNVALEMYMQRATGIKNGWYNYCKADYLVYCDSINRIAYFIAWKKLKADMDNCVFYNYQNRRFKNTIDACIGCVRLVNIHNLHAAGYVPYISYY